MMKKIVILTLAMVMVAGTAFAMESTLTGRFIFEGSYYDNYVPAASLAAAVAADDSFKTSDQYKFADYDMDWRINWKLQLTPATMMFTRISMHDETLGFRVDSGGAWDGAVPAEGDDLDDNIAIERAYLSQMLSPKTRVEAGLMAGGAWGTNFGNTGVDQYKLTFLQLAVGPLDYLYFGIAKNNEQGSDSANQAAAVTDGIDYEKDDYDQYTLATQLKTGPVTWYPLLDFRTHGAVLPNGEIDITIIAAVLAAMGNHGMIGWEAEGTYVNQSFDNDATKAIFGGEDGSAYFGLYGNLWFNLDMAKVGAWVGYGSVDDDTGNAYAFGDDFDSSMIIGDDLGGATDLTGSTAVGLYADITAMEKLTITPLFVYSMSNREDDDTTGMEFDIWGVYQLTDELKYTIGFGYADISYEPPSGKVETDPAMKLYHELRLDLGGFYLAAGHA